MSRPGPKWSGRNPPHTQQFAAGAQPRGPTFTFCNAWESSGRKRHADSSGMLGDLDERRTEKGRRNRSSLRVTNAPKGVDGAWLLKITNNHSTCSLFVLRKDLHSPRLNDQLLTTCFGLRRRSWAKFMPAMALLSLSQVGRSLPVQNYAAPFPGHVLQYIHVHVHYI